MGSGIDLGVVWGSIWGPGWSGGPDCNLLVSFPDLRRGEGVRFGSIWGPESEFGVEGVIFVDLGVTFWSLFQILGAGDDFGRSGHIYRVHPPFF